MRKVLIVVTVLFGTYFQTTAQSQITELNGNVGIGSTNPQEKLEVLGKIRTTTGGSDYGDIYFQYPDVNETGYADVWPDQNERALMIRPKGYLDQFGAGGGGIQFFTYDVTGGTWGSYTGGYKRAMVIRKSGNIGIGTARPSSQLHLASDNNHAFTISRADGTYGFRIYRDAPTGIVKFQIGNIINTWETKISIGEGEGANTKLLLNPDGGNVGIGTYSPGSYRLAVEGTIGARKVKVTQAPWADYVFHPTYRLRPLSEVEKYIHEHHHLPEVPSAEEVEKEGLDLGDNQATLLKKIEELTLYIIEQNKQQEALRKKLEQALQRVDEISERLDKTNKSN